MLSTGTALAMSCYGARAEVLTCVLASLNSAHGSRSPGHPLAPGECRSIPESTVRGFSRITTMRPATKKRLKEMGYKGYRGYCLSDHWKQRKAAYWKTHKRVCAVPGCKKRKGLHLHHVTYDRLGAELDSDLLPLCAAHHKGIHGYMKRKRVKLELAWPKYKKYLRDRELLRSQQ